MGIAWDGEEPVESDTIRVDTRANFIADLDELVTLAGWFDRADVETTGQTGFIYTLASPQGLGCKVKIYDVGGIEDFVYIQFMSLDETLEGFNHRIDIDVGGAFRQVHLGVCQIFLSEPGVVNSTGYGATMQGGIPFVPFDMLGNCGADDEAALTTEAWWSNGTRGDGASSFRNSRVSFNEWSACHNGDLMNRAINPYSELSRLRIVPVTLAIPIDAAFALPQLTRFWSENLPGNDETLPLYMEPLIQWGSGAVYDSVAKIRGSLYNSLLVSLDRDTDFVEEVEGMEWINFMHDDNEVTNRTRFSSLYLLRGAVPSTGSSGAPGLMNYAY